METPSVDIPIDPPEPAVITTTPEASRDGFSLTNEQKVAIVALFGLAGVALILSALLRRRRRNTLVGMVNLPEHGPAPVADIVGSLRHLAQAAQDRFAGQQQQLDNIHEILRANGFDITGPAVQPSETVDQFKHNPSGTNGQYAHQTYEQAIDGQPENISPPPAATSLP